MYSSICFPTQMPDPVKACPASASCRNSRRRTAGHLSRKDAWAARRKGSQDLLSGLMALPPYVTVRTDYGILIVDLSVNKKKKNCTVFSGHNRKDPGAAPGPGKEKRMTSENPNTDNVSTKIISWLDKNRDGLGRKILCSGLPMQAAEHIAHVFPDAVIVFLTDHDPAEIGRSLEQPLVIRSGLGDYDGGMFDTVISVASEPLCPPDPDRNGAPAPDSHNPSDAVPCPQPDRGTFYLRRAALLMDYYENTAETHRRHLREGGTLLSLVLSEHDEYLLGYCLSLAAEGMAVIPSVRQILCRKDGERVTMQAVRAAAGGRTDVNALLAENLNFNLDRMDTSAEEMVGKKAEILLQADASQLVRGYRIYLKEEPMGKLAVYTSVQRADVLYYFTDIQGDVPYLRRFHTEDRKKLLRHMLGELHRQKAADKNVSWHELVLNDDWSEQEL